MNPGDLIGETAAAVAAARAGLGGHTSGAVWFDCILRRLEMDANNLSEPFLASLGQTPSAGFHTYGETCAVMINLLHRSSAEELLAPVRAGDPAVGSADGVVRRSRRARLGDRLLTDDTSTGGTSGPFSPACCRDSPGVI